MLAQGAEAIIEQKDNTIVKTRIVKSYRIPAIDTVLRKFRTRREAKVLQTLQSHTFPCPQLLSSDDKKMEIIMSFIEGNKLRDVYEQNVEQLSRELGLLIAQLHNLHIIHGDLTTSNMIVNSRMYLIDFGLSFFSQKIEDKAVDLHLLKQAIESKHSTIDEQAFTYIIEEYKKHCTNAQEILNRFEKVEERGRNKAKY